MTDETLRAEFERWFLKEYGAGFIAEVPQSQRDFAFVGFQAGRASAAAPKELIDALQCLIDLDLDEQPDFSLAAMRVREQARAFLAAQPKEIGR